MLFHPQHWVLDSVQEYLHPEPVFLHGSKDTHTHTYARTVLLSQRIRITSRVFSHVSHPHSCLSQELSYKLVQRCVTQYLCLVFAHLFLTVRFDVQSMLIFEFCMVYAPRGCLIRRILVKFASFGIHWQISSRFFLHFTSSHEQAAVIFVIYGLDLVQMKSFYPCGTPRTAAVSDFAVPTFHEEELEHRAHLTLMIMYARPLAL